MSTLTNDEKLMKNEHNFNLCCYVKSSFFMRSYFIFNMFFYRQQIIITRNLYLLTLS